MIAVDVPPRPLAAVVAEHAARLAGAGVPSPTGDAWALAGTALDLPPARLRTACTDDLPPDRLERLAALVDRRAARVPLQHLTGEVGFRRLVLRCRPGVFVPRPETEILAGLAIDAVGDLRRDAPCLERRILVAEPCTGTGAVAATIVNEVPQVEVHATDRSPAAVALAKENLSSTPLAPGAAVAVHAGDLLTPLPPRLRGTLDLLVSNPPYLTAEEVAVAEPEVREHDPWAALVADGHPDAMIGRLVTEAFGQQPWLRPGGRLILEVSERRAGHVAESARRAGAAGVALVADLAGRERFVVAMRPGDR
jgi:release factor glutamine methyltransferase